MTPGPIDARERGSGTLLALVAVSASALLAGVLAMVGQVVMCRHRAEAAADLAALAAATAWPDPDCPAAAEIAARNHADLHGCRPSRDGSVIVTVTADSVVLPVFGASVTVSATARAGPGEVVVRP